MSAYPNGFTAKMIEAAERVLVAQAFEMHVRPVVTAYEAEILQLDRWIRAHTTERFGPVRAVTPEHVFELGFEAVNRSSRHKSGIAVRFPRILRWRHDKRIDQADHLATLKALVR